MASSSGAAARVPGPATTAWWPARACVPVAVVGFVHESPCGIAFGFSFEPFAFFVLGTECSFHRAGDHGGDFADGKAAFLTALFAFCRDDLRIRGDQLYSVAVHHEQTQVQPDLRRR